jgi:hypothetical protein
MADAPYVPVQAGLARLDYDPTQQLNSVFQAAMQAKSLGMQGVEDTQKLLDAAQVAPKRRQAQTAEYGEIVKRIEQLGPTERAAAAQELNNRLRIAQDSNVVAAAQLKTAADAANSRAAMAQSNQAFAGVKSTPEAQAVYQQHLQKLTDWAKVYGNSPAPADSDVMGWANFYRSYGAELGARENQAYYAKMGIPAAEAATIGGPPPFTQAPVPVPTPGQAALPAPTATFAPITSPSMTLAPGAVSPALPAPVALSPATTPAQPIENAPPAPMSETPAPPDVTGPDWLKTYDGTFVNTTTGESWTPPVITNAPPAAMAEPVTAPPFTRAVSSTPVVTRQPVSSGAAQIQGRAAQVFRTAALRDPAIRQKYVDEGTALRKEANDNEDIKNFNIIDENYDQIARYYNDANFHAGPAAAGKDDSKKATLIADRAMLQNFQKLMNARMVVKGNPVTQAEVTGVQQWITQTFQRLKDDVLLTDAQRKAIFTEATNMHDGSLRAVVPVLEQFKGLAENLPAVQGGLMPLGVGSILTSKQLKWLDDGEAKGFIYAPGNVAPPVAAASKPRISIRNVRGSNWLFNEDTGESRYMGPAAVTTR